MTQVTRQRSAAVALAVVGLIHLAITPEGLEEQTYIGVLFLLGGVAALIAAVWVWRADDRPVWAAAALMCAAMFVAFVLSRTVGLPGFKESEWEPIGLLSLVAEAWVVVLAALVTPRAAAPSRGERFERRPAGSRVPTGVRD